MIRVFKKNKNILWPVWLMLAWFMAFPAQGLATDLTIEQAVDMAIAHNPELQAAQFQTLSSQEKIIQARSGALPQVYFQEQVNRTTNPMWAFGTKLNQESIAAADFAPDRLNDPDAITNYASRLSVT